MALSSFWNKLSRNPPAALAKARRKLEGLARTNGGSFHIAGEEWICYQQALGLAVKCGRDPLAAVVMDFDGLFPAGAVTADSPVREALALLLSVEPVPDRALEAAIRLVHRQSDVARVGEGEHRICLSLARRGDSDKLVSKLLDRRRRGLLQRQDTEEIVKVYLLVRGFEGASPWVGFFGQLAQDQLPHVHQVYAIVGRYGEAAEIAEEDGDFRSALRYLLESPGLDAARRAITLSEQKVRDPENTIRAHRRAAEALWQEEEYLTAAEHFQKAGDLQRMSDCYLNCGRIADAIKSRPEIASVWLELARDKMDDTVRHLVQTGNSLEAIRLTQGVAESLRSKGDEDRIRIEVARLEGILRSMVRTARAALAEEARNAAPGAEVFRRWSAVEEAAGNFLEAGIQAEFGHDYLTAEMMFEKAGAYGQALRAFEHSPRSDQVERKAELLEHGGDFFMAGLLYESLDQKEKAVALFELSGDFPRAARLLREQLGDERATLDDRYLKLATDAGLAEDVAQMCWDAARRGSPNDRGRLLRRIRQLTEGGYVGAAWSERVALELAEIDEADRSAFSSRAPEWMDRATKDVLSGYAAALGIDLGTSNTVVALYHKRLGQPEIVELEGRSLIPSVFAIDDAGLEVVGVPVAAWLGRKPRALITEAKRAMGSGTSYKAGGRVYQPEEISARIIQCAQLRASEYLRRKIADRMVGLAASEVRTAISTDWVGDYVQAHPPPTTYAQAVITVPAYFNEAQKQATRAAAEIAGVKLLRLVHEPTAACIGVATARAPRSEPILVIDLGAGTLDLSVVEVGDGVFEVLEIEGDAHLGSADLDKILFDHFQSLVTKTCGCELDRLGQRRLLAACEELKIELSMRHSWEIDLPALVDNKPFRLELSREDLVGLAAPWLDRISAVCRHVKSKPDRLLLVGGGTLMPAVRGCIRAVFQLEANMAVDPMTAVARGAAIHASMFTGDQKEMLLLDATPFSLGIKASVGKGKYEFSKVIPKHTCIPTRRTEKYTTVEDDQTVVAIDVYQGESSDPHKNFKIGEFRLEGLLPAKAGVPEVRVTFDIDANCLLTVTAQDGATGRECRISIGDSHLLTPAQMTAIKQRFRENNEAEELLRSLSRSKSSIAEMITNQDLTALPHLQSQLRDSIGEFEQHVSRYSPAASDNDMLLDLYRRRDSVSIEAQLLLDRWSSLQRSAAVWLTDVSQYLPANDGALDAAKTLIAAGESLSQRLGDCVRSGAEVAKQYRQWSSALSGLPVSPTGDPEDVIEYLLRRSRYEESLEVFQRLSHPLDKRQAELGLEVYARRRDRNAYGALLAENAQVLGVESPDFARLNQCIRKYAASIVLVHCETATGRSSGTGFAIGPREIATNLHVVTASDGQPAVPEVVSVITNGGRHQIRAIVVPSGTRDDVAILRLADGEPDFRPLRLGFSEITELGERILTIGFPAPRDTDYEENLYCNTGLVNRITRSELCSERVIEVSIELQGGISGAPILNEFGEVIGLLTFSLQWERVADSGQKTTERSYYAIPVEVLRHLWQSL